ncbi:GntR family transcriptional regulator [Catelliglobosispora koreensis]|uniref:GntR family transcriptional regulator n=1 Tax=Catelliglobosispora koreensis TaxID=129052 RepID=UPI00037BE841|nr:GntR family transcriptional regulator [Catelliglobosispora koreensis]
MSLDRHQPKHLQLRYILLDLIEATDEPDEPIPSERELAAHYGVARMTVRQAVESLVAEGRLFKVTGKGTFIAKPKLDLQARLTSFSEEMTRRGMRPGSAILEFGVVRATAHLARQLTCEPGDDLVHLKRLRLADDMPMAIDSTWLPHRLVPGMTAPTSSLFDDLEKRFSLVPDWGEDTIEAGTADAELAGLLGVRAGAPVLHIERHAYAGPVLVSYSVSFYRADRYKLWVPLARPLPSKRRRET